MKNLGLRYLFILLICTAVPITQAEPEFVDCTFREDWSNLFSKRDITLHLELDAPREVSGKLAWSLIFRGRVIQKGKRDLDLRPGKTTVESLKLKVPAAEDGLIRKLRLSGVFGYYEEDGSSTNIGFEKHMWIFPDSPFHGKEKWLEDLNIVLFDPEEKTAERLTREEIPHLPLHLFPVEEHGHFMKADSLLIIGEGVSFRKNPSLGKAVENYAKRGGTVLCLAAADGQFNLPESGLEPQDDNLAIGMFFYGKRSVRMLDARLDGESWAPGGAPYSRTIQLTKGPQGMVAEITDKGSGWPWLEILYERTDDRRKKGKIIITCFDIIKKWDQNPTPRFLFAKLLERAGGNPE